MVSTKQRAARVSSTVLTLAVSPGARESQSDSTRPPARVSNQAEMNPKSYRSNFTSHDDT